MYLPAHRDLHLAADACQEIGWGEYTGIPPPPTGHQKNEKRKKRKEGKMEKSTGKKGR